MTGRYVIFTAGRIQELAKLTNERASQGYRLVSIAMGATGVVFAAAMERDQERAA